MLQFANENLNESEEDLRQGLSSCEFDQSLCSDRAPNLTADKKLYEACWTRNLKQESPARKVPPDGCVQTL